MEIDVLYNKLRSGLDRLGVNYYFIDVDSKLLFSSITEGIQELSSDELQERINNSTAAVQAYREGLLIGTVLFIDNVTTTELRWARVFIDQLVESVEIADQHATNVSRQSFWYNVLLGLLTPEEVAIAADRLKVSRYRSYTICVLATTKPVKWAEEGVKKIEQICKQYLGEMALVHTYPLDGQLVVVVEISEKKDLDFKKIKKQFHVYRNDLVKQLERLPELENNQFFFLVAESEYYIEELYAPYKLMHDFLAAAMRLGVRTSRVVFLESEPFLVLLQNISLPVAEKFFHLVFDNIQTDTETALISLRELFRHDMNVSQASEALGIHRHTLEYRMQHMYTGKPNSSKRFRESIQFAFALYLNDLYDFHKLPPEEDITAPKNQEKTEKSGEKKRKSKS